MYKLGIDVGGANTDAVLIDETLHVVASIKQHTTANIYDGILSAVRAVLQQSGVAVPSAACAPTSGCRMWFPSVLAAAPLSASSRTAQ